MKARSSYRGVEGSAPLKTSPLREPGLSAEAIEPGEMRRVPFAGELLGALRVRRRFAPIPLDVFDTATSRLEAEEQAAYLHLLRLSVGEGRNFCRLGKRELMDRLNLSERRLLAVLASLVDKKYARPLHRDNRGTLWRVYLPCEAAGKPLGDDVIAGRPSEPRGTIRPSPSATTVVSERPPATPTTTTTTTPIATTTTTATTTPTATTTATATPTATATTTPTAAIPRHIVHTEARLARELAAARGRTDPSGLAAALQEVKDLLGEGQSPERIAVCIETVRRRAARVVIEGRADEA